LQSRVFTIWVQNVSSRLESRYQISSSSVYNTFPFPALSSAQTADLVQLADAVLTIREDYKDVNLGDLYDPTLMPVELRKIHAKIDAYVLKVFGMKQGSSDSEVLTVLFNLYSQASESTLI